MAAFGPLQRLGDSLDFAFTDIQRVGDDLRIVARRAGAALF
jgi:hypothetical protein